MAVAYGGRRPRLHAAAEASRRQCTSRDFRRRYAKVKKIVRMAVRCSRVPSSHAKAGAAAFLLERDMLVGAMRTMARFALDVYETLPKDKKRQFKGMFTEAMAEIYSHLRRSVYEGD